MRQNSFKHATKGRMRQRRGFTLLELSLVIVILSLIAGGITVGVTLYNNYKLTSIIGETMRFQIAIKNFKDQYQFYPGDFPRAETVWGATAAPVACGDPTGTSSTTLVATTCNGSGNGVIGQVTGDVNEVREKFFLWQHLNLSGYLDQQFSGFSAAGGSDDAIAPAINVPPTRFSNNMGYNLFFDGTSNLNVSETRAYPVQGTLGHMISWSMPGTNVATADLITSKNAEKLDRKMDDGMPFSGKVFAHGRDGTNFDDCTTGTSATTANYIVTAENTCAQYYRNFLKD